MKHRKNQERFRIESGYVISNANTEKWKFIFLRAQIKSYYRRELYPLPSPVRDDPSQRNNSIERSRNRICYSVFKRREHVPCRE